METENRSGMGKEWDYLEVLRVGKIPVHIYLISGIRLIGRVLEHSEKVIVLSSGDASQLVYKQAISTVLPQ